MFGHVDQASRRNVRHPWRRHGFDFPHHENEIAQSCGATGKEFANFWIHNGFVQINQEKMSKSLGNFFTIREIFAKSEWSERVTGEVLRYFLISTHYHGPLDFSDQALQEARQALEGFYGLFTRLRETEPNTAADEELPASLVRAQDSFKQAMDNDLNTPMAVAELQKLRSDVNKLVDRGLSAEGRQRALGEFRRLGAVLGLFQLDIWDYGIAAESGEYELQGEEIEAKLSERNAARKRKDFARADEIRKSLAAQGIIIEDKPDGTSRWKR